MGALGGLYRPTPRGTMVIRLDTGPAVSASGLRLLRRLVGPADWPGTEPTGRVRRGRVLPVVDYCSRASNDARWVMGLWRQPSRLAGDHYCRSPSHLVNGTWAPREEPADSRGPTPDGSDLWRTCHLLGSRWLVRPAAPRPYRQAVVGAGFGPSAPMSGPARQ